MVSKSDIRRIPEKRFVTTGHFKCGSCSCCSQAWETRLLHLPSVNFKMDINFYSTCNTKMCVYLVQCFCGMNYIGSTRRKLKVRMCEHRSRIKNKVPDAPMVQHFEDKNHNPEDFKSLVLEKVSLYREQGGDIHKKLAQRETFWIHRLQTLQPKGLNTHLDFSAFL